MKTILLLIGLFLIGAIAFWFGFTIKDTKTSAGPQHELAWLDMGFDLTEKQMESIRAIHSEYMRLCEEHCRRIAASDERLSRLIVSNRALTSELTAALEESSRIHTECRESMLRHFYEISGQMKPEDGVRYLEIMKQQVIHPGLMPHASNAQPSAGMADNNRHSH